MKLIYIKNFIYYKLLIRLVHPIKVLELDLSEFHSLHKLIDYSKIKILIKFYGRPVGYLDCTLIEGDLNFNSVFDEIFSKFHLKILTIFIESKFNYHSSTFNFIEDKLLGSKEPTPIFVPLISVIVCTRNRANDLEKCLASIQLLNYDNYEVIVVDNASDTDDTKLLVLNNFPEFIYVKEQYPGLNWARNRGVIEAKGEIVVYADDDVIVDKNWLLFIAKCFDNNLVMGVTGLVAPLELETEAQIQFEENGGFGRGFDRKEYQFLHEILPWGILGTGQLGTGANMAFRKVIFSIIGYFDPALDVGTVTNGGGDLEFFFRVLKFGYKHIYEPDAIVWHRHRRTYSELRRQVSNNSKGLIAYFSRSLSYFPEQKFEFFKIWYWYFRYWIIQRIFTTYTKNNKIPRDLVLSEIPGLFNFSSYNLAKKAAISIDNNLYNFYVNDSSYKERISSGDNRRFKKNIESYIYHINILDPIPDILNFKDFYQIKFFVFLGDDFIGSFDFINNYLYLSKQQLVPLYSKIYAEYIRNRNKENTYKFLYDSYTFGSSKINIFDIAINSTISKSKISVIIATYDRPEDLKECLNSLINQVTEHDLEIIVVDNNPSSNLTPSVVKQFPKVILTSEPVKGLSLARNKGIRLSNGEIILTTNDNVICPPSWVQKITSPFFLDSKVMIVTGNVLPFELKNRAQQYFERYGEMGKGSKKLEVSKSWFDSFKDKAVPTWSLGASSNAAFRSTIFKDIKIDSPVGNIPIDYNDDMYIYYKTLKDGYTLIYEPNIYVWHKHLSSIKAIRKQLFNYSKGHVAYNLKTWISDSDKRGLCRVFVELPVIQSKRLILIFLRRTNYSFSLVIIETLGYVLGPFSLLKSWFKSFIYSRIKYK